MRQKVCKLATKFALRQNSSLVYMVFWFLNFFFIDLLDVFGVFVTYGTWNLLDLFYIFGVFLTNKNKWICLYKCWNYYSKKSVHFSVFFPKKYADLKKYATDGSDYNYQQWKYEIYSHYQLFSGTSIASLVPRWRGGLGIKIKYKEDIHYSSWK